MLMQKVVKNIPELRFLEFDEDWEIRKLRDISKIKRGRFSPRPRNDPAYYGGDIPFVQTNDVVKSNGLIIHYSQTLNEKGLAVSKLFPKGTILITIAANIGYTGILQLDMACPDSLIGIKCKKDISDNNYVHIYLSTQQRRMDYLAPEGAQKNINIDFLEPYPVPLPSFPEQQKIASFLTAVDKKIEQLTRKKELLEQYKKGVMQKIFSQEIRFKDDNGQDYPNWEEKRLGDIGYFEGGGTPSTQKNDFWNGETPWISSSDLYDDSIYRINTKRFISKDAIKNSATKVIPPNSILIVTRVGVGKVAISDCELCTSQDFTNVIHSQKDGLFLAYFIKKEISRLLCFNQGTSIKGIVKKDLKQMVIRMPVDEEQTKIARLVSSIDTKISTIQSQLTQTQNFKKGLLQKMFV